MLIYHINLTIYLCKIEKSNSLNSSHRMQGYCVSPVCIDEQGGINRTADEVVKNHIETPKLPCIQDSLNKHAGKYVYHTENNFELELYRGISNLFA